jgi:DNA-directed RNA polymerase subunit A"
MEDCKVSYDSTVRNANGNIVQFLYGEDGMDAVKIENQPLPYITMDPSKLESEYLISVKDNLSIILDKKTYDDFMKTPKWDEHMYEHFVQLLKDREFMIKDIFKNEQETSILAPVSFARIITNTHALYKKYKCDGVMSDLNPMHVLKTIDDLTEELFVSKNNRGNKLLGILMRMYLSPKQMIVKYGFNKSSFEQIVQQIKMRYYDSIVNPSEMVGVVAAQSIGEPCTQMSVVKDTIIRVQGQNFTYNGPVGPFIDKLLEQTPEKIITIGKDSVVMDLDTEMKIIGVSNDEKTSWKRISQVSRHPANGGTVKVTTLSGKTTTATLSHSFLKRTANGIEPILGSELRVGHRIPVAKHIPTVANALCEIKIGDNIQKLDKDLGWFVGAYLADGCISNTYISICKIAPVFEERVKHICERFGCRLNVQMKQGAYGPSKVMTFSHNGLMEFLRINFGTGSYHKFVGAMVFGANIDFIAGILSGYFDGDGNTNASKHMIRCGSRSERLIGDVCVLLAYCGIFCSKLQERSINMPNKVMHTLSIHKKYATIFKSVIGFNMPEKARGLDEIIEYNTNSGDRNDLRDEIDMIPALGEIIAQIGKDLHMPGQSRQYGRWLKKEAIGRRTLAKYIEQFEEANDAANRNDIEALINKLKSAYHSNIVWDRIVSLEYMDDPQEHVYDFTVPGNDSFMVNAGVLVHNTLNTFHLSGVASASKSVRGVPRIEELTRVTKNVKAPSMMVFIKDDYNQSKDKCVEIKNKLEITTFKDIVKYSRIYYDPDDFNTTIEKDRRLVELYNEYKFEDGDEGCNASVSPWLLRMELDKAKMLDIGLNMIDLHHTLFDHYQNKISCMFSDDNAGDLIFRIRLANEANEKSTDMLTDLKALESTIIENIILKGISKVNKVELLKKDGLKYNDETKVFEKSFEWTMDTDGTNLLEVLGNPFVDATRTVSNDVHEIYAIFGVEAARQCLFNEINSVMKDAEASVNFRHLSLLVDTMTNKGAMMSIDRHGINKGDIGPLAKCSFEEVNDVLVKAGVFSEIDRVNGVSANIILGQIAPCGTGDTEIMLDEQKLKAPSQVQLKSDVFDVSMMEYDDDTRNQMCSVDNLGFDFAIPDVDLSVTKKLGVNVKYV